MIPMRAKILPTRGSGGQFATCQWAANAGPCSTPSFGCCTGRADEEGVEYIEIVVSSANLNALLPSGDSCRVRGEPASPFAQNDLRLGLPAGEFSPISSAHSLEWPARMIAWPTSSNYWLARLP